MPDRLHQVGLTHPDTTVQEQRVIRFRGTFRDRARGSVSKLVSGADDESVERIFGIQLCCSIPIETLLPNHACRRRIRRFLVRDTICSYFFPSVLLFLVGDELHVWYSMPKSSIASLIRSPHFSPM